MKINSYFKPLACSVLALSVSAVALRASWASQYDNNAYDGNGEIEIRTEYTDTSSSMGFFDQKSKYAGEVTTRIQQRKEALNPQQDGRAANIPAGPAPIIATLYIQNCSFFFHTILLYMKHKIYKN